MKKWDKIIIILLLVISFIPQAVFTVFAVKDYDDTFAVIYVEGEVYERINLSKHKGVEEYVVHTPYGDNILEVVDNQIASIEADCPDQSCVMQGVISRPGQLLVCLPHRMYVTIEGAVMDDDVDIIAY